MLKASARIAVAFTAVLALAACGYDTSAQFNSDGSVAVGLKFLFPRSLLQSGSGTSVTGLGPTEIANANKTLNQKYPGGKVTSVTEGDEAGALITIPFKNEKDAFAFLTQPSTLKPSKSTATTGLGLNLSNTGGLFSAATHTTSGSNDTYIFKTVAQQQSTPSPGSQQVLTDDEFASMFTITFSLTVPHMITSAPGALFTLDRKTAIWKLHWTKAETLTATTGADAGLVASVSAAPDFRFALAVGFFAVAAGFLLGMFMTWRGLLPLNRPAPAVAAPIAPAARPEADPPAEWPGPPSGALPPPSS